MHDEKKPIAMTTEQIKELATRVAAAMKTAGDANQPLTGTGGGSRHRGLPESLRTQFIDVRAALFQRGVYDPVLGRFDTATVGQATTAEVAEHLERAAASI